MITYIRLVINFFAILLLLLQFGCYQAYAPQSRVNSLENIFGLSNATATSQAPVFNDVSVIIDVSKIIYSRPRENKSIKIINKSKDYIQSFEQKLLSPHIANNRNIFKYKIGEAIETGAPQIWGKFYDIRNDNSPRIELEITNTSGSSTVDMSDPMNMLSSSYMSITLKCVIYDEDGNYIDEIISTSSATKPQAIYQPTNTSSYFINPGDLIAEAMNDILMRFFNNNKILTALNSTNKTKTDIASHSNVKLKNKPSRANKVNTKQTSLSDVDKFPKSPRTSKSNNYAIVVGIENYRQELPSADFATNDAILMSKYLTQALGYPEENVITLTNEHATKSDLDKYLGRWLQNNVETNSKVFIYFSGHGAPNPHNGDAYLVPYDGDPAFIEETGYSLKNLYVNLQKLKAKNIIVALDACFSGAGGKSVAAKGSRALVRVEKVSAQNIAVLTASADNQISSSYDEKGHGVFSYYFFEAIKNSLEKDKSSKLEIGKIYEYIKPKIEKTSRKLYNNEQTPQLITSDKSLYKAGIK